jgi:hypothetical protein
VTLHAAEGRKSKAGEFALQIAKVVLADRQIVHQIARAGAIRGSNPINLLLKRCFGCQAMAAEFQQIYGSADRDWRLENGIS